MNKIIAVIAALAAAASVLISGDKSLAKGSNAVTLIRNATMKITYAGRTILTDPMLSPKGAMEPFAGIARNPTVELPAASEKILEGVDCVLVSHDHPDHFDTAACALIPKKKAVFCQPGDEAKMKKEGFVNAFAVETSSEWNGITITRTGGAKIPQLGLILMDADQTLKAAAAAPKAIVVAIHMESLDHCDVTRGAMREAAGKAGVPASRLAIPADGGSVAF